MSVRVCLAASALHYSGGGYLWAYLNWALGLRRAGCEVVWLELAEPGDPSGIERDIAELRSALAAFDFAAGLAVHVPGGAALAEAPLGIEDVRSVDLLVDLAYMPSEFVRLFRRSALVDIDPGLTQAWIAAGELERPPHDVCFTIGETAGTPSARFPDCGVHWEYTTPCADLETWTVAGDPPLDAPYSTVSHWWQLEAGVEIGGDWIDNSKRASFLEVLDLPRQTAAELELTLGGLDDSDEQRCLESHGWRVRDAEAMVSTPASYWRYVRESRGEFACAKPAYVQLRSGWLSDRTVCYMASGRPAIVQDTGGERTPYGDGLLRFCNVGEAAAAIDRVEHDYAHHSRAARSLAEERFDAREVTSKVLERAIP